MDASSEAQKYDSSLGLRKITVILKRTNKMSLFYPEIVQQQRDPFVYNVELQQTKHVIIAAMIVFQRKG